MNGPKPTAEHLSLLATILSRKDVPPTQSIKHALSLYHAAHAALSADPDIDDLDALVNYWKKRLPADSRITIEEAYRITDGTLGKTRFKNRARFERELRNKSAVLDLRGQGYTSLKLINDVGESRAEHVKQLDRKRKAQAKNAAQTKTSVKLTRNKRASKRKKTR